MWLNSNLGERCRVLISVGERLKSVVFLSALRLD